MKTDGERKRHVQVDLRQREPLHVQHVGAAARERADDAEVLDRLQRQPRARALEEARRERIEALDAPVADRRRQLARSGSATSPPRPSAPARASAAASSWSYQGVYAGGSAMTTRTAPTVERGARPQPGTSSTATRCRRAGGRICARWSSSSPPTGPTSSASRRCPAGRSAGSAPGRDDRGAGGRRSGRASAASGSTHPSDGGSPRRHHGVIRSAFAGQGNSILVASRPAGRLRARRSSSIRRAERRVAAACRARASRRTAARWSSRTSTARTRTAAPTPSSARVIPWAEARRRRSWWSCVAGDFNILPEALRRISRAVAGTYSAPIRGRSTRVAGARRRRDGRRWPPRSASTAAASSPTTRRSRRSF